jgi:hypothetical protein
LACVAAAAAVCVVEAGLVVEAGEDAKVVPVVATSSATAANLAPVEEKTARTGKPGRAAALGFTPEREAAAMTFVRTHHPELATLLTRLKDRRPGEYQKAIRDLFRVSERLAQSQEMHPNRYELELEEWKLTSRVQLLVARLTMDRSAAMEQELRDLLAQQLEVHEKVIRLDRDRAAERVKSLDAELSRLAGDRQQVLEEKFQKALRSAGEKKQQLKAQKSENRTPKAETK